MTRYRRTYRNVDGQRVEGTWRHVFTRNMDTYFLSDLVIYADGAIDCGTGGLTDLNGLAEQLRCGRVATALKDGAWASAHHLAVWRFTEPSSAIKAEMLLGEASDEIDRLNGRPDSTGRCLQAVQTYLTDPTEDNRRTVRERYLAIPEHLRVYALGDMDRKDAPLQILITNLGDPLHGWPNGPVVTEQKRAEAFAYFREREIAIETWDARVPADGPEHPMQPDPKGGLPTQLAGSTRRRSPAERLPGSHHRRRQQLPQRHTRLLGALDSRPALTRPDHRGTARIRRRQTR